MKYNGIVVDLGAGLTQISPVQYGYTSQFSSNVFKVTGNAVDEYLYKLIYSSYNFDDAYQNDNIFQSPFPSRQPNLRELYKIKMDLKETSISPYQIPFNFEVLT